MNLKDKVVVITGGASGLGQATARYMVNEKGAKVALLDLNAEAGAETVAELGEESAIFCQTDVTSEESIDVAIAAIMEKFGAIHMMGTVAIPSDAYRYAKGDAIRHPAGFDMQLEKPLDFYAVTDHAMFLGLAMEADFVGSEYADYEVAKKFQGINDPSKKDTLLNFGLRAKAFADFLPRHVNSIISGELPVSVVQGVASRAWTDTIQAARDNYEPGVFTTFVAYEYTSIKSDGGNLHRNVFFRDGDHLPAEPFSTMHSENPEHLWDWMDMLRSRGVDSLAIPHNPNGSNGHMFEMTKWDGSLIDESYVQKRRRNEPIVEITQIKGTSEAHPKLSPNDEWANFELTDHRVASSAKSEPNGSYVRQAYQRGLELERQGVGNPYDFGVIGSSDTHNAASGVDEEDFVSKIGFLSSDGKRRGAVPLSRVEGAVIKRLGADYYAEVGGEGYISGAIPTFGASGLAGVWAESNTREAIFDAMKRKETFATSGPRISVRFFAGSEFDKSLLNDGGAIARAYAQGVSMGGALQIERDESPAFFVWAMSDPDSALLQRVQVIKVWIDETYRPQEAIFDVACAGGKSVDQVTHRCPENRATVDLETCEYRAETGARELKAVWKDPSYEPFQRAVYYARVLENPTCRWSTWDAIRAGVTPRPDLPATIQERAWSSAIQIN